MLSYKTVVREYLSSYTDTLRSSRNLTQESMAEQLRISCRAYGDLERGKYCFSALALMFLMLMMEQEERQNFLAEFEMRIFVLEHGDYDRAAH